MQNAICSWTRPVCRAGAGVQELIVSIRQPRLAKRVEHHSLGRHAAGVRISASGEAEVIEGASLGVDVPPENLDGRAAEKPMPHRLGFGGDFTDVNGLGNFVLRQNLPQTHDRALGIASAAGFQEDNSVWLPGLAHRATCA